MPNLDKALLTLKEKEEKPSSDVVVIEYDGKNFEACKSELLSLLDKIIQLNPADFGVFLTYKTNLAHSLTSTTSAADLNLTLNAVRSALKAAYSVIKENPKKLTAVVLNFAKVDACLSAAGSHILNICQDFLSRNLQDKLIQAKKETIKHLAVLFIKEHHLLHLSGFGERIGNEVHYVHALFNHVAGEYGLNPIKDSITSKLSNERLSQFSNFLKAHLNYRSIVHCFITHHPLPTEAVSFERIEVFLQELGSRTEEGLYQLYEEERGKLKPRDLAMERYQLFLYHLLIKNGLLSEIEKITLNGNVGKPLTCILFYDQLRVEDPSERVIRPLDRRDQNYLIYGDKLLPSLKHDLSFFPEELLACFINKLAMSFEVPLLLSFFKRIKIGDKWHEEILRILGASNMEFEEEVLGELWVTAVKNKDVKLAALLFNKCSNLNLVITLYGETPLFVAAQSNALEILQMLLDQQVDVNKRRTLDDSTPLHIAAQHGHHEVVAKLLKAGANIDAALSDGATALFIAAKKGHHKVVAELLKASPKPNIDAVNSKRATALMVAAEHGHDEIVAELLKASPQPNIDAALSNGVTALFFAAEKGHHQVVAKLLKADPKPNINAALSDGATALYIAAQNGHPEVVAELLKANPKPDIDAITSKRATALMIAAQKGHHQVVVKLLNATPKPNIDAALLSGATALFLAAEQGHYEVVAELLKASPKPNIDALTIHRTTALIIAAEKGHHQVVLELLKATPKPNFYAVISKVLTPLSIAAQNGHRQIVEALFNQIEMKYKEAYDKELAVCFSENPRKKEAVDEYFKALFPLFQQKIAQGVKSVSQLWQDISPIEMNLAQKHFEGDADLYRQILEIRVNIFLCPPLFEFNGDSRAMTGSSFFLPLRGREDKLPDRVEGEVKRDLLGPVV